MPASVPSFRRRARLYVASVALVASAAVPLGACGVAVAAPGDYAVSIPYTVDYPGFWVEGKASGGPFNIRQAKIGTGIGSYPRGALRWWRINVPDPSVRITGGRIVGHRDVRNDDFVATVRQGTDGGAVRMLVNDRASGPFSANLVGDMSFLDFGLQATSATSTTTADGNSISFSSLTIALRDSAVPAVAFTQTPSTARWHGPGCVTVALSASDRGAGLAGTSVANATTGAVAATWGEPQTAGLRPGPVGTSRSVCVDAGHAVTGTNVLRASASDSSGHVATVEVPVRFDLGQPRVAMLDGRDVVDVARPAFSFETSDAHSGIATVSASVDGIDAQLANDRGRHSLRAQHLSVGQHVLVVDARDQAGNRAELRVTFRVRDVTAPELHVPSPTGVGGPAPRVVATAADEGSGVDAHSWRVSVNGIPVAVNGTRDGLDAAIGMLSGGTHAIEVSVADFSGNRAVRRIEYTVPGMASTAGRIAAGQSTGLYVAKAPRGPVRYGSTVRISALATSAGRPLGALRLQLLERGKVVDSALSDVHGVADLRLVARRPLQLTLAAAGAHVQTTVVHVAVAPRIGLRAAKRRVRVGAPVRITGRVQPGRVVSRVSLEARVGGTWFPLRRSVRVRPDGRFATNVTAAAPGAVAVRVRASAQAGWSRSLSGALSLRVHR